MTTPRDRATVDDCSSAARDHLWLHFTRMGGYRDAEMPVIVRGDGCYLEDANGKRYLDALAGLFAVQIGYGYGDEIGQAARGADARAALLHELVVRAPARDRAGGRGGVARARRPEPRLLRLGRLGGGRVGVEARAAVPRGARRAALEGDRAPRRLPRDDDGRALDQRHPGAARAVRAARPRGAPRAQHEPLPPAGRGDRGGVHARSCSTTSSRRSSWRGPRPSRW